MLQELSGGIMIEEFFSIFVGMWIIFFLGLGLVLPVAPFLLLVNYETTHATSWEGFSRGKKILLYGTATFTTVFLISLYVMFLEVLS
jgi:hypothetical protein